MAGPLFKAGLLPMFPAAEGGKQGRYAGAGIGGFEEMMSRGYSIAPGRFR
jgi:hypothetical protein